MSVFSGINFPSHLATLSRAKSLYEGDKTKMWGYASFIKNSLSIIIAAKAKSSNIDTHINKMVVVDVDGIDEK